MPAVPTGKLLKNEDSQQTEEWDGSAIRKKEIKTFDELLANFPMIARQMQPGLERLFREFGKELGKPLPPPPSQSPPLPAKDDPWQDQDDLAPQDRLPFNSEEYFEDDEDLMRRSLETAVTAAIDLFRLVDKQQLSLLGATTDLTGPMVERLIERYVAEQVHSTLLFPRLCNFRKSEDAELDARIRQMENIDVSQVGITIEGGRRGKQELVRRLNKGVEVFRKMADARCPQDMLDVLLATIRVITEADTRDERASSTSEKNEPPMTVNADMLVSLLLVVVIRSQIRHLQARLLYMQHFIFVDDVESGEMGYALSTFEAVLAYLARGSAALRKASSRNKRLWQATKTGNVSEIKAILKPDADNEDESTLEDEKSSLDRESITSPEENEKQSPDEQSSFERSPDDEAPSDTNAQPMSEEPAADPPLAHVFPFQARERSSPQEIPSRPRKKVSMDVGSLSGSSGVSLLSRTTTIASTLSGLEGDSSIATLTQTQDPAGDSALMMAVVSRQPGALKYLLSLQEYYPLESVLEDTNYDGTTLLSAAVQHAHREVVDVIVDYLFQHADKPRIAAYLSKADTRGRTVAHYLFSAPYLLSKLDVLLPWTQKDRNGQTPLFALCRSYDHPEYHDMVTEALTVAQRAQGDGKPLRLDEHVDAKGNTLLHIVSDPAITARILRETDCDPNATNDRKFTPLMMASKYGRVDQMRRLFMDPRVDIHLKESRGLTAVELAKDDDVRNRVDDLILFLNSPMIPNDLSRRITGVVRSFFVEDGTVRFIVKSGAQVSPPQPSRGTATYSITTCRRTFSDFENLAKWLSVEHPASYIPEISERRNPFQIQSKPSRAVLHDMQSNLDQFLKILLAHPTFSTHEMLWEFFLVPELQPEMMADRSRRKAAALYESIYDDYEPATAESIKDTEQFVSHAQEMVRAVHACTNNVLRRGHALRNAASDLGEAINLLSAALSSLGPPAETLPGTYVAALSRFATALMTNTFSADSSSSSPLTQFLSATNSIQGTTVAIQRSLSRPTRLIQALQSTDRNLARARSSLQSASLPRKFNLNFPGLEESRQKNVRDLEQKIQDSEAQAARLAREITWNKDVVVGELAGWTSWRERVGRDAIRAFVRSTLIQERERGRRLERCLRMVKEASTSVGSRHYGG